MGPLYNPIRLPVDEQAAAIMRSREAMYGRVTYNVGPVPSYIQTYPGSGLTPAMIQAYQNTVLVQGWMVDWCSLIEQVLLRDAHMSSVDRSRRSAVAGKPLFVRPSVVKSDAEGELATKVADYVRAAVDQIDGLQGALYELLVANAQGFSLAEIVWTDRPIHFAGRTLQVPHPQQLDWVHGKHVQYQVSPERPTLPTTAGKYAPLVPHKFVYHIAVGDGYARRRGYMYQTIWLHMIKHQAIARWAVCLEIWGIPVPWGKVDQALWQDETRKAQYRAMLQDAGLGKPFLTTDDLDIQRAFETTTGDARGMHAALIGWANSEISKVVQLQTLTTELGGVGSYNASETHAAVKETGDQMDARQLENTLRDQLFTAILEYACYQYDEAGNRIGIHPQGLCAMLGASPDDILRVKPRAFIRVDREMTPQNRAEIFSKAVGMGLSISSEQFCDEFGLNRAHRNEDRIPGEPITVADGAAAVGQVAAAQEGLSNPKDPPPAKPAPAQNTPTPAPRAEEQR